MKKAVSFRTTYDSHYLFSPFRNQVFFCHPLIHFFRDIDLQGKAFNDLVKSKRNKGHTTIPGYGRYPDTEIRYQLRKYKFLKKNQFFKTPKPIRLGGRIPPAKARENIAAIRQVIFETTEDCNLSCTYCTYSKYYINKQRGKRNFDPVAARAFLDYILSVRNNKEKKLIVSFYGGEPLKNMAFIRGIVGYLKSKYQGIWNFRYTMSTNGLLLSKYAEFLVSNNFDISVSLDGNEENNSFRLLNNEQNSFPVIVKNLDHIRKNYPDYFESNVSFLTVLHRRNSFREVHEFFKERYGKPTLTSLINTQNVNRDHIDEFRDTFLGADEETSYEQSFMLELFLSHPRVKEFATITENYAGIIFKNHLQVLSRINGDAGTKEFIPTATCQPFGTRVYLTADGSVIPCEHIGREHEMGTFKGDSLNINFEEVVSPFNRGYDKIETLCATCFIAENCKECLFNTRIGDEHPVCDYYLDEKRFGQYLSKNYSMMEEQAAIYQEILKRGYDENA